MCGIYGSINKVGENIVIEKLNKIKYRGPDYAGIKKINDNSFLAHLRLAIIDIDARSNQPFDYLYTTIVFNGEIYNYAELKSNLSKEGYNFHTNSDTEVICAAYIKYGESCVNYFNGMFSFIIYDKKENKLFGARDRLGKKPFFYIHDEKTSSFEFASQLSPLIYKNNLNINWTNVSEYFFWGYNQDPNTPFIEVKKLPAGYSLLYDIEKCSLKINPFWELPTIKYSFPDYLTAKETLKGLINDAVKLRMMSDVPLGIFLSGGVDSSLIAAVAQNMSENKIKTFSISFNENKYDESFYSRQVAERLGTSHHEFFCEYSEVKNFIENFDEYFDEPFADMSAIPTLLLAQKTKEVVTVALSGDGGDELFCGYERYEWLNKVSPIYKLPLSFRKSFLRLSGKVSNYKLRLILAGLGQKNLFELYSKMVGVIKPGIFKFDEDFLLNNVSRYWSTDNYSLYEKMALFDIKTYLNNDINTKVDRAAMRFSLETRAPLLDYRIAEFSQQIPLHFKILNKSQKFILKDILYDYLPKEFFERPKAGFAMPFKEWFRHDLKEFVLDTLSDENLKNIPVIDPLFVKKMIQEHMSGKANHALELWKLISWIKFIKKV